MDVESLSRFDLEQIVRLVGQCLGVSTAAQLEEVIERLSAVISFEKAAACIVGSQGGCPPRLEHFVNHSFGKRWEETYTRGRLQGIDPVLRQAGEVNGVFRWSDEGANLSGPSGTFQEAARDHGLVDGVTFSAAARATADRRTVLTLAGIPDEDAARVVKLLSLIGPHIHEAYQRLILEPTDPAREPLSEREKEVLNWAQHGKTYWEIGCILGISERTVKFHFQRIKEKLDVVSPSHAVARALRLGIIN